MRERDRLPIRIREVPEDMQPYGDPPSWAQSLLFGVCIAVIVLLLLNEWGVL